MSKALRFPDYLGHFTQDIECIFRYTECMGGVAFLSSELVGEGKTLTATLSVYLNVLHSKEAFRRLF